MNPSVKWLAGAFAATAVVLLALEAALRPNPRERNWVVFTEMVTSRAGESMTATDALPGGTTQLPLEPGVVVRGTTPFRYGPGPDEAARAGRELANPFGDTPDVLERGARVYRVFCGVCHGADGAGGPGAGPVVRRGMTPPPSLHAARAKTIADGEMFHVLTLGQGNMASYAVQVPPDDRWRVIRYVRALQEKTP